MSWIERLLDNLFRYQTIYETDCDAVQQNLPSDKNPYLKRYFVYGKKHGFAIWIHKIISSDPGKDLHDHSFNFVSIILKGGYTEETYTKAYLEGRFDQVTSQGSRQHKPKYPGMILYRPAKWAHRLEVTKPAWTLVFRTAKNKEWGFFTRHGWIHWKKYDWYKCNSHL